VSEFVDPLACPLLALVFPPDGDVPGAWDCPPYASSFGPENGQGHAYGKGKRAETTEPEPDPPTPVYPSGTITIEQNAQGAYEGSTPTGWTCGPPAPSVQCTAPEASGTVNVCRKVTAAATNGGVGTVTVKSRCTGAGEASATSSGPTTTETKNTGSAGDSPFPWTCAVTAEQLVPGNWSVTCTVGPN